MEKIQRLSSYLRLIFQISFIALPIVVALYWVNAPREIGFPGFSVGFSPSLAKSFENMALTFTPITRILGFFITFISVGFLEAAFYFLIKLFKTYEHGEIFSSHSVNYIKKIGYVLLLEQLFLPICDSLMTLNITWHSHPKVIAIGFDKTNLGMLLVATMIILVSWIMAEACKLREEQLLTV